MPRRPGSFRLPFTVIEPYFGGGLFDDPLLLVRVRPAGSALLFDCGQLQHLATRLLKSVRTVFVSHPHMDHFIGLATLIRHHHVAPRTLELFGPPGITERTAHLLSAFAWNLAEPFWCTLQVHEVFPDRFRSTCFPGPAGFLPLATEERPRPDATIYADPWVTVSAVECDHKLPVLAFRLDERPPFSIDPARLAAAGLRPGPWIRELKRRLRRGEPGPLSVSHQASDGSWRDEAASDLQALYASIQGERLPGSLGYLTDVGATPANLAALGGLLQGVSLLVAESAFLQADLAKARDSFHLTSGDLAALASQILPRYLLPTHFSKAYQGRSSDVYAELELPSGTRLIQLPDHLVPAPLQAAELIPLGRPRRLPLATPEPETPRGPPPGEPRTSRPLSPRHNRQG